MRRLLISFCSTYLAPLPAPSQNEGQLTIFEKVSGGGRADERREAFHSATSRRTDHVEEAPDRAGHPALAAVPAFAGGAAEFPGPRCLHHQAAAAFSAYVGDRVEVVTCKAEFQDPHRPAYVAADGMRRVDLQILDWKADGYFASSSAATCTSRCSRAPRCASPATCSRTRRGTPSSRWTSRRTAQFRDVLRVSHSSFGQIKGLYGFSLRASSARLAVHDEEGRHRGNVVALLPESISSMSAAGEVTPVNVTVRPAACLDLSQEE